MTWLSVAAVLISLHALAAGTLAQDVPKPADAPAAPEARPGDVESIDSILTALYETVSGPKGQPRDLDRLRSLFAPGARLIPVLSKEGKPAEARVLDIEAFLAIATPAFNRDGFFEREVARKVDHFGHIAQVFSTYEARRAHDEPPFVRGINSIQLFHDGARWWVLTISWDTERPGTPIPPEYLPGPDAPDVDRPE